MPKLLRVSSLCCLQGKDKTWVQDAPQRILYTYSYAADSVEEDNLEHLIIIVLAAFFVLILICIIYDVYRTNKKYRQKKEFETDASILLSKKKAAIMLQENNKPVQPLRPKVPDLEIIKPPQPNGNMLVNDNGTTPIEPAVAVPEEQALLPLKRADSKREKQKRISFRGE